MARVNQKEFYQNNYETHGITAQGVAWDSTHTQRRRFSMIASCLGDINQVSMVDAGCGFGDFYLYLKEQDNLPKNYVGLDLCAPMVEEARVRTGCKIEQRNILQQSLPVADWYVASGSINLLTRMETRIFIQRCFAKSKQGFVFNLLEGREREGEFSYWKVHEVLALCYDITTNVQIKEGYLEGDLTVVLS